MAVCRISHANDVRSNEVLKLFFKPFSLCVKRSTMTFKKKLWNQLPLFLRKNLIDHKQCGLMLDFKEAPFYPKVTQKVTTTFLFEK